MSSFMKMVVYETAYKLTCVNECFWTSVVTICYLLFFQLVAFLTENLECTRGDCDALVGVLKILIKQLKLDREVCVCVCGWMWMCGCASVGWVREYEVN